MDLVFATRIEPSGSTILSGTKLNVAKRRPEGRGAWTRGVIPLGMPYKTYSSPSGGLFYLCVMKKKIRTKVRLTNRIVIEKISPRKEADFLSPTIC